MRTYLIGISKTTGQVVIRLNNPSNPLQAVDLHPGFDIITCKKIPRQVERDYQWAARLLRKRDA